MQAQAILDTLSERGAVVIARGRVVAVTPRAALDDLLRASIREHRDDLLALLNARAAHPPDLAAEIVRVAAEEAVWLSEGSPRCFPAEVDVGAIYRAAHARDGPREAAVADTYAASPSSQLCTPEAPPAQASLFDTTDPQVLADDRRAAERS